MTWLRRHRLPLLGALMTLAVIALWLLQPGFLARLDLLTYDLQLRAAAPLPRSGELAIVEIDEASLQRYGQWPWPRQVLGELVETMRAAGASVIVIDAVFAEPEQRLAPTPQLPAAPAETGDSRLARSLQPGRVVLGHYFRFDQQPGSGKCTLHPVSLSTAFRTPGQRPLAHKANSVTCSTAALSGAAAGSGFLNASPDADGVLRRVPLLMEFEERSYPSLALAAVLLHRQLRTAQLRQRDDHSEWLTVGERSVPVGPLTTLQLRYPAYREGVPRVSAAKLSPDSLELKGRIVLFGANAAGLQDLVATPLDSEMPGTDIHAAAIENLLAGSGFHHPPNARLAELLLIAVSGLVSTWLVARFRPLTSGVALAAVLVILWFGSAKLLDAAGVFVSPALAIALALGNLGLLSLVSLAAQRHRADTSETQAEAARQFMVSAVTNLAAVRDLETAEHLARLQRLVWILCVALRSHPRFDSVLSEPRIALLAELVPIHDIGKLGIPREILQKPGRLTPEEFEEVKKHVEVGRQVLEKARTTAVLLDETVYDVARNIVCHHHERWDGTGYPGGLRGEDISAEGRIVALLDVYDALVNERVYKKAMSHDEALDILRQGRGTHFDPAVVDAFLRVEQTVRRAALEAANGKPQPL
jgi:adenylate cyclase